MEKHNELIRDFLEGLCDCVGALDEDTNNIYKQRTDPNFDTIPRYLVYGSDHVQEMIDLVQGRLLSVLVELREELWEQESR